jgi:YggT family protein
MGRFLYFIVSALLQLETYAIIANAIISWLIAFDVINLRHPFARQVARFLDAVTAPVLRPFQRFIPPIGGVDITPVIALLVIQGVQIYLLPWMFAPVIGALG